MPPCRPCTVRFPKGREASLLPTYDSDVINAIFDAIDLNGNGLIDFDEFQRFADPAFQQAVAATKGKGASGGKSHLAHMHDYNRRGFS